MKGEPTRRISQSKSGRYKDFIGNLPLFMKNIKANQSMSEQKLELLTS